MSRFFWPTLSQIVVALLILFSPNLSANGSDDAIQSTVCTKTEAIEADSFLDQITSWQKVYEAFRRYGKCDDGGLAESYSDKIVTLLADKWESIDDLAKLCRKDTLFERFIFKYIDELMSVTSASEQDSRQRQQEVPGTRNSLLYSATSKDKTFGRVNFESRAIIAP